VQPEVNVEPYPDNVEEEVAAAAAAALTAFLGLATEAEEEALVAIFVVLGGSRVLVLGRAALAGLAGGRLLVVDGASHARFHLVLRNRHQNGSVKHVYVVEMVGFFPFIKLDTKLA
jgi:hypothetical protein